MASACRDLSFPFPMSSAEWLLNDEESDCYCVIFRNVIPAVMCEELFQDCSNHCFEQHTIKIMGKDILQPRFTCAFSDPHISGYTYSGNKISSVLWTQTTADLRQMVALPTFYPNSCLVNGYITPDHYVGWHSDKVLCDPLKTVITVSVGGTRRFSFRKKSKHSTKVTTYLHNGDVVYFYGKTNELYDHSILKLLKSDPDRRPRYSLTFRILSDS